MTRPPSLGDTQATFPPSTIDLDDVGVETGIDAGGKPAADVAADHRVADQDQRRPDRLRDAGQGVDRGIDLLVRRGIGEDVDFVERIGLDLLGDRRGVAADDHRMRRAAEFIGDRAGSRSAFERDSPRLTVFMFDERNDVFHYSSFRSLRKSTICLAPSTASAAVTTLPLPRTGGAVSVGKFDACPVGADGLG